jgi:hypothetical protein
VFRVVSRVSKKRSHCLHKENGIAILWIEWLHYFITIDKLTCVIIFHNSLNFVLSLNRF